MKKIRTCNSICTEFDDSKMSVGAMSIDVYGYGKMGWKVKLVDLG